MSYFSYRRNLLFSLCAKASLAVLLVLGFSAAQAQDLLWSEEFNSGSAPDPNTWSYDLGTGNNGWGNFELQEYTNNPANVAIANGHLTITAREKVVSGNVVGFTSARMRSQDKLKVKYGTIEARIKIPDLERGLWPAFWTLGNSFPDVPWPDAGELDVMEMGKLEAISAGRVNRTVYSTAHWENLGSYASFGQSLEVDENLNDDFHVFTMDWTPNLVTTYVDGQKIWEMDISPGSCTDCTELHQPHFLILNMAVGGTFTGMRTIESVTADMPAELVVDYIRVYDNGFTEVSGTALGAPDIGPAHSGSWANTDQDGHGFSAEFSTLGDGTPIAVIYWYTYDDQGNNVWMLGVGFPEGNRVEVNFEAPYGMIYGEFDPVPPENKPFGGTGVFVFEDRDNATFSYTPSDFTAEQYGHLTPIEDLPLTKLLGIPADLAFPDPTTR